MKVVKMIGIEIATAAAMGGAFYGILAAAAWIENSVLWNRIFDFIFR